MISRRTFLKHIMVGGATLLHVATTTPHAFANGLSAPLIPPLHPAPFASASRHGQPATDLARRWVRNDAALANATVLANTATAQPWTWGAQVLCAGYEEYADAPNGQRMVWYFPHGRMEVTRPDGNPHAAGFISFGALVREMVGGTISTGEHAQQAYVPALLPIVGDAVPAALTVTYADLYPHTSLANDTRTAAQGGSVVTNTLTKHHRLFLADRFAHYNVVLGRYDTNAGHNVAQVFDDALGADHIAELAGAPLSEPVWISVPVDNTPTDLLIQLWERRVLVYNPTQAEGERVRWNEAGRHYAQWRYGILRDEPFDPRTVLNPAPPESLADLAPATADVTQQHAQTVGAAVFNLRNGTLHQADGDRPFSMYSTVKLPIMLALLDQAQHAKRDLTATEDAQVKAMIQISDNDATDGLLQQLGATAVNMFLNRIGITSTNILDGLWGSSTTTAEDMALLLGKLANGTILDRHWCAYALDVLRGVEHDQRWGVGDGAADGTVALKNGWFPDDDGWGVNSIGIVDDGATLYAVALYSAANASMGAGMDLVNLLAHHIRDAVH